MAKKPGNDRAVPAFPRNDSHNKHATPQIISRRPLERPRDRTSRTQVRFYDKKY